MKKNLTWAISAGIILLLLFNLGSRHVKGVKSEKDWYLSQLEFDFSGIVDNPEKKGQALFYVTHGRIDLNKESQLKKQLRFNGLLDLFLYRQDGKIDLMIPKNIALEKGDSVYINTNLKIARFFRRGELISEHSLSKSLRCRPF
jgi:hypothetical protein